MTEEMSEAYPYAAALAALQAELPKVHKDADADVGQYSYKYANLESITDVLLPILAKHGLSFSALPTLNADGRFVLRYHLRHVSGEEDGGDYPLSSPDKVNSQKIGSEITYARRYALCAVTGLAPSGDDDDGKTAAIAQDSARATRPAETEATQPNAAANADVNAQIIEWVGKLGWTPDQARETYSKWFKGASLGTASLPDRQRFVVEMAAHYMNETKRQERTEGDSQLPREGARPEGQPEPVDDSAPPF